MKKYEDLNMPVISETTQVFVIPFNYVTYVFVFLDDDICSSQVVHDDNRRGCKNPREEANPTPNKRNRGSTVQNFEIHQVMDFNFLKKVNVNNY